jgi:Flp pilus assembly protein TadD
MTPEKAAAPFTSVETSGFRKAPPRSGRHVFMRTLAAIWLAGTLTSCAGPSDPAWTPKLDNAATTATVQDPLDTKYFPSDEPYRLGVEHFNRGQYGLAEQYFRAAVEKAPKDVASWMGLAASYDRLGRFDLADRAYDAAIRLSGQTVQVLNNQGYSYLLRGDLSAASLKFLKALEIEPANPTILNNIKLAEESTRYIRRSAQ